MPIMGNDCMQPLRWLAALVQATAKETDTVTIAGVTRTVGDLLDEADAALEPQPQAEQPTGTSPTLTEIGAFLKRCDPRLVCEYLDDDVNMRVVVGSHLELAVQPQAEQQCTTCEPAGVFATDGTGPYDCYACGKKAEQQGADARSLLERSLPFLRDEASNYDDDGSNEPLELMRDIECALAARQPVGEPVAVDLSKVQRWDLSYSEWGASISHKPNGTFVKLNDVQRLIDSQHQQQESGNAR